MQHLKWLGILGMAGLLAACGDEVPDQQAEESAADVETAPDTGADYSAVLTAEGRGEGDYARDESRKPAEVLARMNVRPGDEIIDLGTGSGYYAEIFARAAGPDGMVHAINLPVHAERFAQMLEGLNARAAKEGASALHPMVMDFADVPPFGADSAFMGQLYHDAVNEGVDLAAMNAAVFNALKPGGVFVIEEHIAPPDSGVEVTDELHRWRPDRIKEDVLAAGFELVEENYDLFANPDDPLDISVFDPAIRGKTARVLFVFRKPEA